MPWVRFLCIALITGAALAQEPNTPLQFNAPLSGWTVRGPFDRDDGPAVDQPGKTIDPWAIDFLQVFDLSEADSNDQVAVAETTFNSPREQDVTLSISHDDDVIAWLNDKEIHRNESSNSAATVDQVLLPVRLRQGRNHLVVQVGQSRGSWEAAVRILPAGADRREPDVELWFSNGFPADVTRLPVLSLMIRDVSGATLQTLQTSGYRDANNAFTHYPVYLPEVPKNAAQINVRWGGGESGLLPTDKTIAWKDRRNKSKKLRLLSEIPLRLRVTNRATGESVSDASVWKGSVMMKNRTRESGDVSISHLSATAKDVWIAAEGYEPYELKLPWPWEHVQEIALQPGGRTVRGIVTDTDGNPIAGAKIAPGLYRGYTPTAVTDEAGRFEFVGIPNEKKSIAPVIEARGYVIKDTFIEPLAIEGVSEFHWKLEAGATFIGRVTDARTGDPVAGVTIAVGSSRMASNRKVQQTRTRPDGSFLLQGVRGGKEFIHAFSDDYAPQFKSIVGTLGQPNVVEFELLPGKPITGTVADENGAPLRGVWLVTDTWGGLRMLHRNAYTDAMGKFRFEHMPDDQVEVHVLKQGFASKRDLMVSGGDHVDVKLSRLRTVHYVIRDADNQVVPDLKVDRGYQFANQPIQWRPGYEGQRFFDADKATLTQQYGPSSNRSKVFFRFRSAGFADKVVEQSIAKDDQRTEHTISVRLEPMKMLPGLVRNQDTQQPVSDVRLALVSPEDRLTSSWVDYRPLIHALERFGGYVTNSDDNGRFEIPSTVNEDKVLVAIRKSGGFQVIPDWKDQLVEGVVNVSLEEPCRLAGVITRDGKPIANESVQLSATRIVGVDNREIYLMGSLDTDADGRFDFGELAPGAYQVSRVVSLGSDAFLNQRFSIDSQTVDLKAGQNDPVEMALPVGVTVSGKVVDEDGKSVQDAAVRVLDPDNPVKTFGAAVTDKRGEFTLQHVPAGECKFIVHKNTGERAVNDPFGMQPMATGEVTTTVDDDTKIEMTIKKAQQR